ncbi:unnamed protein product [Adineta ricciae]|uniref:Ig-like domain-containing protein n=1 Tax=Adineta ricciae TaxID=249248 RepID=A0A814VRE0_ADIRI|nr:unnamed protein product [Adineta ricciae]CAF1540847.1 unnamed protein product [Adineta ricciae]
MKAVIAHGPKEYKFVDDKEIPKLKDGEVLVKVLATGICGSDLKMYEGSPFYWGVGGRARSGVIPGHEFVGEIVEVDPQIAHDQSLTIGDVIVAEQLLTCRDQCWYCKNSLEHKCEKLIIYGQGVDGSMAEYMIYQKGSFLHKVPQNISPIYAVLAEPLAVSVRAMDRASLKDTDLVVISGCGTIGLGVVAAIHIYFPQVSMVVLDYHQFKLDQARLISNKCSTFNLSDNTVASIVEHVRQMSGERKGADVFFECSGSPHSIKVGFDFLRACGTFLHVGICKEILIEAPWNAISAGKELTVVGTNLGRHGWSRAFEILQKCDLSAMITHRLPLNEYDKGLGLLNAGIKIVLDPTLPSSPPPTIPTLISNENHRSVVFITQSSHGIGRLIAVALAQQGATVILHGSHHDSPSEFKEGTTMTNLKEEIAKQTNNNHISCVWGHLTSKESVQSIVSQIQKPVDTLICCDGEDLNIGEKNTLGNGQSNGHSCLAMSEGDARSTFEQNFWSTYLVCQAIVPQMTKNLRGQVVLIGSSFVTTGQDKHVLHSASKAALQQYMRCLANESTLSGIRVNWITPGSAPYGKNRDQIAEAVSNLLKMSFMNGQVIRLDGNEQTCCC